ncbi:Cutinase transcription factor 1 beta [Fusarium oxysporum f. sp. albedinis]|nr:Cutinase transcription factor 1 beta [Fusarium oxysporum f. sp. albedinis]
MLTWRRIRFIGVLLNPSTNFVRNCSSVSKINYCNKMWKVWFCRSSIKPWMINLAFVEGCVKPNLPCDTREAIRTGAWMN